MFQFGSSVIQWGPSELGRRYTYNLQLIRSANALMTSDFKILVKRYENCHIHNRNRTNYVGYSVAFVARNATAIIGKLFFRYPSVRALFLLNSPYRARRFAAAGCDEKNVFHAAVTCIMHHSKIKYTIPWQNKYPRPAYFQWSVSECPVGSRVLCHTVVGECTLSQPGDLVFFLHAFTQTFCSSSVPFVSLMPPP